ncbi:MAG: FAD-binding domain-containing protein [Cyanobacteriota bacterium]|nr:FAD-binding domain-containing protein [Cyanobacteriota bacterium]
MALQVVWFRRDLRLSDSPALCAAARGGAVLPLFVLDRNLLFHPETASSRVAFLLASLQALDRDLRQRGGRLLVRQGDPVEVITALVHSSGADAVVAHADCERIVGRVRDAQLAKRLIQERIALRWIEQPGATACLLPYHEYRRFWHGEMAAPPLPAPARICVPPAPDDLNHPLADLPIPSLAELGLRDDRKPLPPAGTRAAERLVADFCAGRGGRNYSWQLSQPAALATTGISPHLKFGQITARQVIRQIEALRHGCSGQQRSWQQLVSRLRWGAGMAQRFRYLPQLELRSLWSCHDLPDEENLSDQQEEFYRAWREGRTGFPIVDAAARCLEAEGGWRQLNFRSRAIYASFLVNLCGIDWRFGALHYMRHLFDGDCPIDHYQWAMHAGVTAVGARAWTRIYHPGQVAVDRCDPQGIFIRRWLPQLADLTNDQLGMPPQMSGYPRPILDYESARRKRLAALEQRQRHWRPGSFTLLPDDVTPFGAAVIPTAKVQWARLQRQELLPAALDPSALDQPAMDALLSWFQTRPRVEGKVAVRGSSPRRRQRPQSLAGGIQLSLLGQD